MLHFLYTIKYLFKIFVVVYLPFISNSQSLFNLSSFSSFPMLFIGIIITQTLFLLRWYGVGLCSAALSDPQLQQFT